MFSGIKIIPRDEVLDDSSEGEKEKSKGGKDRRRKNKDVDRKDCRREGSKKGGDGKTIDGVLEGDIARKRIGLDFMLQPTRKADVNPALDVEEKPEETTPEEVTRVNPRELNPYMTENGSGYPEEEPEKKHGKDQLLQTSVVGDGGASWRMKALKRAKEQAAREGQRLEEVAGESGVLLVTLLNLWHLREQLHLVRI